MQGLEEHRARRRFPLVDRANGIRMGLDFSALEAGEPAVVASERRLSSELSYGYTHALWWMVLSDGRSAVSVPPGAGPAVQEIICGAGDHQAMWDEAIREKLKQPVDGVLRSKGMPCVGRVFESLAFACDGTLLRRHNLASCHRLYDEGIPTADGLNHPTHCYPDGVVFGVVADGVLASVAYAHRTGTLEDRVGDLGVETAEDYRRRGYAKAAVSAVVAHFVQSEGEARYGCSPKNEASIATARSVGFVPYGKALILAARRPEQTEDQG